MAQYPKRAVSTLIQSLETAIQWLNSGNTVSIYYNRVAKTFSVNRNDREGYVKVIDIPSFESLGVSLEAQDSVITNDFQYDHQEGKKLATEIAKAKIQEWFDSVANE